MGLLEGAVIALVIALIAGGLGFTGVARGAATAAKVLFGIFLIVAVVIFAMVAFGVSAIA